MAAESLTPTQAKATIESLGNFASGLRCRTEGITWMIWALAGSGISFTYAFASAIDPVVFDIPGIWYSTFWFPWVAAGYVATGAVWNSVAITLRVKRTNGDVWRFLGGGAVWMVLVFAAVWAAQSGLVHVPSATFTLLIFTGACLFFGGLLGEKNDPGRTHVWWLCGFLTFAAAASYFLNVDGWMGMIAGTAVAAASYFALGAKLAFRS